MAAAPRLRAVGPAAAAAVPAASTALAPALVLTGCTGADAAGGAKPSSTSTRKAASGDRGTVGVEVRALVRAAGPDPAQGRTASAPNGVENPSRVDRTAVLDTPRAERSVQAVRAEAERRGWHPEPLGEGKVVYEKSGWMLMAGSSATADVVVLRDGGSLLAVLADDWGRDRPGAGPGGPLRAPAGAVGRVRVRHAPRRA
ncbi:hypothetical protein ACFV2Q_06130 [Streptomyces sp. NPDC059650]|uniref:hypothetical protein n=1 Tax=Streptomyces sp. NPDC059650 TaxID=3346896 RepID=UPI0036BDEC4D